MELANFKTSNYNGVQLVGRDGDAVFCGSGQIFVQRVEGKLEFGEEPRSN